MKKKRLNRRNYNILETAVTLAASFLVKELIKKSWEKSTDKPAPENLASKESSTKEVFIFAFSLALVSATVKIFTRKGLSKKWKKMGGKLPKELN